MSSNTYAADVMSLESLKRDALSEGNLSLRDRRDGVELASKISGAGTSGPHHLPYDALTSGSRNFESDLRGTSRAGNLSRQQNNDPCPYYYDAKLELKMYQGPGFSQFHPVLGSMAGHKEICDEWDARQLKGDNNAGPESTSSHIAMNRIDGTSSNDAEGSSKLYRKREQYCLEQVLLVFPQVQHDFVRKLLREQHPGNVGSLVEFQVPDTRTLGAVIAEIADMESFPKQKDAKRKHSPTARDREDITISWNKDILKNETYYKEALVLLADEFTRIPTHFINKTLRERGAIYDTFHVLTKHEHTYNNGPRKPYIRSKLGRKALEKKYHRTAVEQREGHQYISIVNEFQAARQQQHREETRQKRQKDEEESEAQNFTLHQLQGSLVDCQCCFNEAPINRAVNCENDDTHFFCNKCIGTRAKEQIGALKHEMMCMDTSGCGAELSREALAQALPIKILDKIAEIQQLAEIKAAGLDGLEQCPFCDYQAVCPPVDADTLFECLNPDCEKVSCRKCKEESHVPRSCEEAKKRKGLSSRHAIEEARSEAMMRSCPRCKVKIVKSAGCNKMACSNCRAVMCYVCKKDITGRGYEHFGSSVTACPLVDRPAEDRHQREADDAENAAIAAAKAQDADVNVEDLRIEAHLNQRPGRASEVPRHRELHRPPAGLQLPVVPQFPPMDGGNGHLFPVGRGVGLLTAERAVPIDNLHHPLRGDRIEGMLEDQQQQPRRLQPFVLAPVVPPLLAPPRPDHSVIPPTRQAHQFSHYAHARPKVESGATLPPWNPFNGEANGGLTAHVQGVIPGDLQLLRGCATQKNHSHPVRRNGYEFPARHPPTFCQDYLRNPPLWAQQPAQPSDLRDYGISETQKRQT